jgi:hypothetical protein
MTTTSADQTASFLVQAETSFQSIFGWSGLQLTGDCTTHFVVESGTSLVRFHARCRATLAAAPAGSAVIALIRAEQTGLRRLVRWVVLPLQMAVATRGLARTPAIPLGCFAAYPDISTKSVTYELRSPAQRYAEQFLIPRLPESWLARTIRRALARWAGCDPSVSVILVAVKKL